ncbi:MAG: tautomerase family protein [Thermoleophilia bacterium]|jgi:phenylpyruvate tautomerase PptA (4-oxalocrotonate tautomerase family)
MPVYEFTAPAGAATLDHRAEIARAVTRVHSEITGAPAHYVRCSFTEAPSGSTFVSGEESGSPRMMGLIRSGRSKEVRGRLLHGIADAWSEITGDSKDELAIFLYEVPAANCFESGTIMPEASEDVGAVTG